MPTDGKERAGLTSSEQTKSAAAVGAVGELKATREAINELVSSLDGLASTEDIERVERERRSRRQVDVTLAVVVVAIFGCMLGVLINMASVNRRNGRILVECTTASRPGDVHECFEDGARRTADAIEQIKQGAEEDHQQMQEEIERLRQAIVGLQSR